MTSTRRDPAFELGPWIAAGVLVVVGIAVWFAAHLWNGGWEDWKRSRRERELAASLLATDLTNDMACQAALRRIEEEGLRRKESPREPELITVRERIEAAIEGRQAMRRDAEELKRLNRFLESVTGPLETADGAEPKSSDELLGARRILVEHLDQASGLSPKYEDRIEAAIRRIDHILVGKMRDEASAVSKLASTTPQQGLAKYATAEDYVRKAIWDANKSNNKAGEAAYTEIYKDLLEDSDEYSQKVITPEFIESIPWKDLLADGSKWSKVTNVPGFSCRVTDGVLGMTPPDAGSKMLGIAGILDQPGDNLRHFVLDMEFAVEGAVTVFFHVAPPPGSPSNLQSETCDLSTRGGGFTAGAKYTLSVTYVGSDIDVKVSGNGDRVVPCRISDPRWSMRRRGGIAFVVPEGGRLTVTRMRIKELR